MRQNFGRNNRPELSWQTPGLRALPVACIHIAAIREPYEDEPYFYKTSMICYDYELIYAVGSMLGGSDVPGMMKLIDSIEAYGLDCMSTGVVLAWATEAFHEA